MKLAAIAWFEDNKGQKMKKTNKESILQNSHIAVKDVRREKFARDGNLVEKNQPIFENLITKQQLTKMWGISLSHLNRMIKEEGIPYVKIGRVVRFSPRKLASWQERTTRP